MPGARCTRDLVCNVHKKMRTRAYRAAEAIRHSLRNGLNSLYVLSPAIRPWVVTVIGGVLAADLMPALRRQDHTFSPYASVLCVQQRLRVHRSPSRAGDVAQRPSEWDGISEI